MTETNPKNATQTYGLNAEPASIMIPAWLDGVLTPVEKLSVHKRGLKHKAVSVFILNEGRILIQQRAMEKYHTPGLWANTCCTHPEWDEDSLDCAIRRLNEELGINGTSPTYRDQLEYRANVGGGLIEHEVVDVFVAEVGKDIVIAPNPSEVMNTRWVNFNDLTTEVRQQPERFTPWLRIYLQEHAAAIFGDVIRPP